MGANLIVDRARDVNTRVIADGKLNLPVRLIPPLCLWLEELGPAFGLPLEDDGLHLYSFQAEHIGAITQKNNAANVAKTLVDVQTKLAELQSIIKFEGLEVVCRDSNPVAGDVAQKLKLWKELECYGCHLQDMLSCVKVLQEAWNDATWEISSNVRARSLGAAYLETCAKALSRAAAALSNNQKNGSHRQAGKLPIERKPETQRRHGEQEDEKPPGFHAESKDRARYKGKKSVPVDKKDHISLGERRKRYNKSVRDYVVELERAVSNVREA